MRFKAIVGRFLAVVAVMLSGAAHAGYSQMYVFGDSTSDTGLFKQITGYPTTPFFHEGRFSNGPVAAEYLAESLGLTLTAGVNNFAVGGAFSGYGNNVVWPGLENTGMFNQFDAYQSSVGVADPDALYFIWGGSNNFNACFWFSCTPTQIQAVADNISSLVTNLAAMGAQHFFVSNLYAMNPMAATFNGNLEANMNTLIGNGLDITYFDARAVMEQMYAPTNPWGFTVNYTGCYVGSVGNQISVCANPDTYIWGYSGHLTAASNRVMGEAMIAAMPSQVPAEIPEPQTVMLLALGLLGLVAPKRWFAAK